MTKFKFTLAALGAGALAFMVLNSMAVDTVVSTGANARYRASADTNGNIIQLSRPESTNLATTHVHAPAAATAAVVTYAAGGTGVRHAIWGISYSYAGGAPTGGNLKIEDGAGVTVFTLDISAAGADTIIFPTPVRGSANTALIVTLASGGGSVVGKVNVLGKTTE